MTHPNPLRATGAVVWQGPSPIDGSPLVAILTRRSANRKTGDMPQLYILRADRSPVEASRTATDDATCGHCPLRHSLGGGCYVNLGHGPQSVYRAFAAGRYPEATPELLQSWTQGKRVRLGAYGDPAMLPESVIERVTAHARGWTGYTHQYAHPWAQWARHYMMASADTPQLARDLRARGWRTFALSADPFTDRPTPDESAPTQVECPADTRGTSCADCGLCDGTRNGTRPATEVASVVIRPHGFKARKAETLALSHS